MELHWFIKLLCKILCAIFLYYEIGYIMDVIYASSMNQVLSSFDKFSNNSKLRNVYRWFILIRFVCAVIGGIIWFCIILDYGCTVLDKYL